MASLRTFSSSLARQVPSGSRCVSSNAPATSEIPLPPVTPPRSVLPSPRYIKLGPTQLNRYEEHYRQTLAPSLLYMTYDPEWASVNASEKLNMASTSDSKREWDPSDPYSKNRPERPPRGLRRLQPGPMKPDLRDPLRDLVQLERIVITSFCKEAITNKHNLLPLIAQLRAVTGVSPRGSFADPAMGLDKEGAALGSSRNRGHISIVRAKSGSASFKLRSGMPVGAQAVLPRPLALNFLEVLVTFVLPRLRTFQGFLLPPASQPSGSPAAMSGVVSLGLGPEAMGNFPQTEVNWEAFGNKGLGFQVSTSMSSHSDR